MLSDEQVLEIIEKITAGDEYNYLNLFVRGKVDNVGLENQELIVGVMKDLANDLTKAARKISVEF